MEQIFEGNTPMYIAFTRVMAYILPLAWSNLEHGKKYHLSMTTTKQEERYSRDERIDGMVPWEIAKGNARNNARG